MVVIMRDQMYSKKVMELFHNPRNMGSMKNPDGVGKIGNRVCGDVLWMYIRVARNRSGQEYIKDIKIKTYGCVAAISTSSKVTDMAKGRTLEDALKISNKDIVDLVDGLPPQKVHCSVLAVDALHRAIEDYQKKSGKR